MTSHHYDDPPHPTPTDPRPRREAHAMTNTRALVDAMVTATAEDADAFLHMLVGVLARPKNSLARQSIAKSIADDPAALAKLEHALVEPDATEARYAREDTEARQGDDEALADCEGCDVARADAEENAARAEKAEAERDALRERLRLTREVIDGVADYFQHHTADAIRPHLVARRIRWRIEESGIDDERAAKGEQR